MSAVETLVPKNEPRCCVVCGTEIGHAAVKCIKCGSFQTGERCTFCHLGLPTGAEICPSCKNLQKSDACISCGAAIPCGCKRCSECGSWQNWRRFFQGLEVSFALILSFVSVISAVAPFVVRYWTNHSETYVRMLGSSQYGEENQVKETTILVLAANNGKRMSFVDSANLTFSGLDLQPATLRVRNISKQALAPETNIELHLTGSVLTANGKEAADVLAAVARGAGEATLDMTVHETDRDGHVVVEHRTDKRPAKLLYQWMVKHVANPE